MTDHRRYPVVRRRGRLRCRSRVPQRLTRARCGARTRRRDEARAGPLPSPVPWRPMRRSAIAFPTHHRRPPSSDWIAIEGWSIRRPLVAGGRDRCTR